MLSRFFFAASLCVAACAATGARAAGDVPIVIGETGDEGASPAMILPDGAVGEIVPTEPPPVLDAFVADDFAADEESAPVAAFAPASPATCAAGGPAAWDRQTTVDVLFIDRENAVGPLAVTSWFTDAPGATVIATDDVRYPMSPGGRIFQAWRKQDCMGLEVGYLGVSGMHADASAASAAGELALPDQLGLVVGSGLDAATAIRPVLNSTLNSGELNLFSTRTYDGCRRHDRFPWRRVGVVATADWLVGLRYAYLDESANLFVTATVPSTTDYRVTTSSQLFGSQIGHRRRFAWGDWALEGWAKVGLMASILSQSQSAVVGPFDLVQVREPRKASTAGAGMIGDLNATVVRRLGDHWGVRAGYTLLWLTGVAPAASQWDFTDTPTSGTGVVKDTVFLHGATLGLEAQW